MNRVWGKRNGFGIYECLCIVVLYMPWHYYICECLLSNTKIDNVLRDIVIVIMFVVMLYKTEFRIGKYDLIIIANCFVMTAFAVVSILGNNFPGTANILRTYLVPQLIFFIASRLKINEEQYRSINKIVVIELALIAIYGVFQAFVLGDKFLIKIGYPSDGFLLSGYSYYISGFFGNQRSVGTFISPNVCGTILAIAICVYMYSDMMKRKKIVFFFLIIGLAATFSRSAIVGLLLSVIAITHISGKKIRITRKMITLGIGSVIVGLVAVVYIDSRYFDGLFSNMVIRSLTSALNKTDPSAKAHMENLFEPISIILGHPFGLGFGNNGPIALDLSSNANIVESSFYLMIYELGIVFGMAFFAPYACTVIDTIRNKLYKNYLPAATSIVTCFTYVLLPNVQTYEILFYSFMYMGFYYNPNVKNMFNSRVRCFHEKS